MEGVNHIKSNLICIICSIPFRNDSHSKNRNINKLDSIVGQMWNTFLENVLNNPGTKYKVHKNYKLKWRKDKRKHSKLLKAETFPFCSICKNDLAKLCFLNDKLTKIQEEIFKMVLKFITKILESSKENEFFLKDDKNTNCTSSNSRDKENVEQIIQLRQTIVELWTPILKLPKVPVPATIIQYCSSNDMIQSKDQDGQDSEFTNFHSMENQLIDICDSPSMDLASSSPGSTEPGDLNPQSEIKGTSEVDIDIEPDVSTQITLSDHKLANVSPKNEDGALSHLLESGMEDTTSEAIEQLNVEHIPRDSSTDSLAVQSQREMTSIEEIKRQTLYGPGWSFDKITLTPRSPGGDLEEVFECCACYKTTRSENVLRDHITINHSFDSNNLETHVIELKTGYFYFGYEKPGSYFYVAKVLNSKPVTIKFHCGICETSTDSHSDIVNHFRSSHSTKFQYDGIKGTTPIVHCRDGRLLYAGKWPIKKCNTQVEGQLKLKCVCCDRTVTGWHCLKVHFENYHSYVPPFSIRCPVCRQELNSEQSLERHIYRVHPAGLKYVLEADEGGAQVIECALGKFALGIGRGRKTLAYKKRCNMDQNSNSQSDELECCVCRLVHTNHSHMVRHFRNHHISRRRNSALPRENRLNTHLATVIVRSVEGKLLYDGKWPFEKLTGNSGDIHSEGFKCTTCDCFKKDWKYFRRHMKLKHDIEHYVCDTCGKSFQHRQNFLKHIKIHDDQRGKFLCDVCGKAFVKAENLELHRMRMHGDVEKFKKVACTQCPKTFYSGGELRRHMACHSKQQNFQCPECPKKFKQQTALQRHRKSSHAPVKPYPCPQCEMRFTQKQSVGRHVQNVHSETRKAANAKNGVKTKSSRASRTISRRAKETESEEEQDDSTTERSSEDEASDTEIEQISDSSVSSPSPSGN